MSGVGSTEPPKSGSAGFAGAGAGKGVGSTEPPKSGSAGSAGAGAGSGVGSTEPPKSGSAGSAGAGAGKGVGSTEPPESGGAGFAGAGAGMSPDALTIRAAVLEETGAELHVDELELAPPGPGEVLVRLQASGICHSDQNAIDGTAATRCPAVLGHEGAGIVETVGDAVMRVRPGDHVALSWAPSCGACPECLRELPQLCSTAWPAMGEGGLLDGTTRLSRRGEPVFHYSFISSFAEACVVPERSCVPISPDVPFAIAGLVGCAITTGVGAVWRTAGVRPGDRVAVVGCGGVGLSAVLAAAAAGAGAIVAVDPVASKLDAARELGATDGVLWAGSADETAAAVADASGGGVDYAIEATGRPEAMLAAFLSTRPHGAAVLIGIPATDAVLPLPALSIPRMERRILGSLYGSSRPERDFPLTLDLYRRGRLPLDRLVTHRLPLDAVGRGFELMRSGEAVRVVLDLG